MKKNHMTMAVLGTVLLSSCVQEKSFNDNKLGKNDVAFIMQTGSSTRAVDVDNPVQKGISVPIGKMGDRTVFLEETVTDLSYIAPETRGIPAYTQNVGILYRDKLGVYAAGFGDATYESMDEEMVDKGWRYFHNYGASKWPEGDAPVDFFLRMPSDMTGISTDGFDYAGGSISFDYTSPKTAAAQQDILFAKTTLKESVYKKNYSKNGAPAHFYHALTAVKFAIDNDEDEREDKGIVVTGISFKGIKNKGTCTFADNSFTWDAESVDDLVISQSFTAEENVVNFDKTTHKDNNFADSFFSAGTEQNINKADASYTFWLIPQNFTATSTDTLRIDYTMSGVNEYMEIPLNLLAGINWQPGQLRTYTIRLDEVNVKIEDYVEIPESATPENGYKDATKKDVVITNTGNTKAFIRAAIVGQWLDENNNPVFGFTDEINQLYVVESWYEDQFVNGKYSHGHFVGLPGYGQGQSFYTPNPDHDWQLCDDDYYYYTKVVNPGDATGTNLFTSYVTKIAPAAAIAGYEMDASEMHFELEIATQAISAVKIDGTEYTWTEAWTRALGKTPAIKPAN